MYKKLIVNLALLFALQVYADGENMDLKNQVINDVYQDIDESKHVSKSFVQPWFSQYMFPAVQGARLYVTDWILYFANIFGMKNYLIKQSMSWNGLAEQGPNLFSEESLDNLNPDILPMDEDERVVYESRRRTVSIESQYLESLSNPQARGVDFIHQLYADGLKPSQALDGFYDWLDKDPSVQHLKHLLIKKNRGLAKKQALDSDKRWQKCIDEYNGDYKKCIKEGILKKLDGIIIAVKDEIAVEGYTTTDGLTNEVYKVTKELNHSHQSEIITYLVNEGVVIAGKANQKPFGFGATGHNPLFLELSNPYSPGHDTAGSSSASGVFAVIGGAIAVGTDAGGSINMPAAISGAQGIKPTEGKITTKGYDNPAEGLTAIGFIANNYQDLAKAYLIGSKKYPMKNALNVLETVKIGVDHSWFQHCSMSVCNRTLQCLDILAEAMKEIGNQEPIRPMTYLPEGHEQDLWNTHAVLFGHSEASGKKSFSNNWGVPAEIRLSLEMGANLSGEAIEGAKTNQEILKTHFQKNIFSKVHVIAMPTTLITAPERVQSHSGELNLPKTYLLSAHTSLANLTGSPRVTIMCGYDKEGLPIGLQLMADRDHELILLRLGAELEKQLAEELEEHAAHKSRPYFDIQALEVEE